MSRYTNKSALPFIADALVYGTIALYLLGVAYHIFAHFQGSAFEHWPGWFIWALIAYPIKTKALMLSIMIVGAITGLFFGFIISNNNLRKLHGDAKWANSTDIKEADLFADAGILLGKYAGKFICTNTDTHVAVVAPPREGKGVGIAIPNALNWRDSLVVLDIRKEIFNATSGFRAAHGQKIYLFDPGNPDGITARFNPLSMISNNKYLRVNDIQKIAEILWPTHEDKGEVWNPGARSLFTGLVLGLLDTTTPPVTLGGVLRFMFGTENLDGAITKMFNEHYNQLDPICIMNCNAFITSADKEQSGVRNQLRLKLTLWENPVVDAATSASDFDLTELRTSRTTIYVGVSPDNLARLAPLLNLFFQQAIDVLTSKKPDEPDAKQVLFLLDEFTALGYMGVIEKGIGFLGGFKVRLLVIIQDFAQLEKVYGRDSSKTFLTSFAHKVMLTQNNEEAAQYISKQLGFTTVKVRNTSFSQGSNSSTSSSNYSHQKKELMLAQQIMRLSKKKEIILVSGAPPILAKRIVYYKEATLKGRVLKPIDVPALNIEHFYNQIPRPILPDHKDKDGKRSEQRFNKITDAEIKDVLATFETEH